MSCTKVGDFCKTAGEKPKIQIPLSGGSFIKLFKSEEILAVGDYRRPPKKANGFEYEVTQGGQCVKAEPEWPTTIGGTVMCGSVQFTCRAISNSSLARIIQSVVWSVPTGTITISGDGFVNTAGEQEVYAFANGGVKGEKGEVLARITFNDSSIEDALLSYHVD